MAKITLATIKSFVRRKLATGDLYLKVNSKFDGMTDGVEYRKDAKFEKCVPLENAHPNQLGVEGIWIVTGSGNLFTPVEMDGLVGYEVYNCCGSFVILADSYK